MRFNELARDQPEEVMQELLLLYPDRYRFNGIFFNPSRVKHYLELFDNSLKEKLLSVIASEYYLSSSRANEIFGKDLEIVNKYGFLLFYAKSDVFLPSDEFVSTVFSPDSLVYLLTSVRKEDLNSSLSVQDAAKPKYQRIRIALDNPQNGRLVNFTQHDVDQALAQVGDYQSVIGVSTANKTRWMNTLYSKAHHYYIDPTVEFEKAKPVLSPLIRSRKLFFVNDFSGNLTIHWHPNLRPMIEERMLILRRERKNELTALISSAEYAVLDQENRRLHIAEDTTLRDMLVIIAKCGLGELPLTQEGSPKKAGIKKLAKLLSHSKEQDLEEERISRLYELLCKQRFLTLEANGIDLCRIPNNPMPDLEFSFVKKQLIDEQSSRVRLFESFLESLPEEKWIGYDLANELFHIIKDELTAQEKQMISEQLICSMLFVHCDFLSSVDLVIAKKNAQKNSFVTVTSPYDSYQIKAIRKVSKPAQGKINSYQRKQVIIQGNFEVLLTADIAPKTFLELTKYLDIKSPTSLHLSLKSIQRAGFDFETAKEFLDWLSIYLEVDLPVNVRSFIEEKFEHPPTVFVMSNCVYLYDPSTLERVEKILKKQIRLVIDNRLMILKNTWAFNSVISKLQAEQIRVKYIAQDSFSPFDYED